MEKTIGQDGRLIDIVAVVPFVVAAFYFALFTGV